MKFASAICAILFTAPCFSQAVWSNNGATANIISGTIVSGVGVKNDSGRIINSGTAILTDVFVNAGSTFSNQNIVKISGAMGGTGSITSDSATVFINGTSAQTIPSGFFSSNKVQNLTISDTAGVTLNGTLGIRNTLLVSSGTFNANGYLTLLSDSNATALIDGTGGGNVTGNVTMQRYLTTGFGYHYIGSPFQNAKVSELRDDIVLSESFPTVFSFAEDTGTNGWIRYIDTSSILYPLMGYAVNTGDSIAPKTIDLRGVVNNGALSIAPANHGRTNTDGFNLVSNPYPSPIDWKAPGGWVKTNLDDAIYYFDNGTINRYTGSYSSHINGVSSNGKASNYIASMQGFFIHVKKNQIGKLQVDNDARINNFNVYFHKEQSKDYPLVRLTAGYDDTAHLADPTVVYFNDGATDAFENELDAVKMMNTDLRVPNFYSVASDVNFAINAIATPDETTKEIPLVLKLDKDGTIVFKAADIQNLPPGLHGYFADAAKGEIRDLEQLTAYKIPLAQGSYENRFYLIFSRQKDVAIPGLRELNAYVRNQSVVVILADGQGNVVVTDVVGRTIAHQTISGNGPHEITLNGMSGIYIVSMTTSAGRRSKKLIVGAN